MSNGTNVEELKSRINLHAILPVLEDLERLERAYGGKGAGKSRGTLVMTVEGNPELSATLWFKGGGMAVLPEKWRRPSLTLIFPTAAALNASFAGGKERPKIKGIMGLPLLPKFMKLTKLMAKSLEGDRAPGGIKTRAALLLKVVVQSMEILAHHHPEVMAMVAGLEGVMQFGIEPDGPNYHLVIDKGKVAVFGSKHSSPKSTITWTDSETVVGVLSGKLQPMEAMGKQKMKMIGDPGFALQVGGIMNKVGEILQPKK